MDSKQIVLSQSDFLRLQSLVESFRQSHSRDVQNLASLAQELEEAVVVEAGGVPGDVVTMNSRVRVHDLQTGRIFWCRIVYPCDADSENDQISVLAPIGTALLGDRVGRTIEWRVPSGLRRLKILEVEYPAVRRLQPSPRARKRAS